ncbi:MAG: CDGSH iron-sulfur domain-containing protein [Byssovorax sp.]
MSEVQGKKIIVRFEGKTCIHARQCVLGRPDVFVPNAPGEWIHPDEASPEDIAALAKSCPSGAITYERLDGGEQEQAPKVNLARVRENGPIALHGELQIEGQEPRFRATLCRCGASKNKPFCDGAHAAIGFQATGEPPTAESQPLAARSGPLVVKPLRNGPVLVTGNVEVVSGTGRTVHRTQKMALCRCGASANKPYCDGSHARVGFSSD